LVEKFEGKKPLDRSSGRIILKWILEKQCRKVWTGFMWLMIGTSGELL
jgi:hypothetical protein